MVEQPLIADVIELTLNHGAYTTRKAKSFAEATLVLDEWQPHLAVVDMDIGGDRLVWRLVHLG
jgi:CheY-like chemotaxis protein